MSDQLLVGRTAAFLGCTDEHQLADAIEIVQDGASVTIIPGPSQFVKIDGEETDASALREWYFAMRMAESLPDQVTVREPPPTGANCRGWGFSTPGSYLAWALDGIEHLDLLCVSGQIVDQRVWDPAWLEMWFAWIEGHGGGDLITYDGLHENDSQVWLTTGGLLRSGAYDHVVGRVEKVAGPKEYLGWLTADPWLDPLEPIVGADLGPRPSVIAVLAARTRRYGLDPRHHLPPGTVELISSGADVLADRIWRPAGASGLGDVVVIGDEDHLSRAVETKKELHLHVDQSGCYLLPLNSGAGSGGSVLAFVVVDPGGGGFLQVDALDGTDDVATAVRLSDETSFLGSRWPWREIGHLSIMSGRCAIWLSCTTDVYDGQVTSLKVVPGDYVLETKSPAAWRIRHR